MSIVPPGSKSPARIRGTRRSQAALVPVETRTTSYIVRGSSPAFTPSTIASATATVLGPGPACCDQQHGDVPAGQAIREDARGKRIDGRHAHDDVSRLGAANDAVRTDDHRFGLLR